uniref:recombinase family protein n=1 Tax=Alkalibacillus haloalkaliphilus TaxID=94136 RepID=UPI000378641D
MTNPIKAALYARVSTEEQATEGYSIQGQIEEMETYANQHDMKIVKRYLDEGVSGKNISGRPQMKQLVKDLNSGEFDAVIIYKIDRIARRLKDALDIAERCEQANVKLISLKENMDLADSMGIVIFQLSATFAEFERNLTVERLKMGMSQRAKI